MKRVLVVDDETRVIESLSRLLKQRFLECRCDGVTSGEAALKKIAQDTYDVVILDVQMPGKDGIEILTRLKADATTQHIPVIMLTGHADKHVKQVALELGAYDFLEKPTDPHELIARLSNAIRIKEYEDRLRQQNDILESQLLHLQRMELVGYFATGIVHDLNNILGGIVSYTDLAASRVVGDPKVQNDLECVLTAADHATRLVKQILSLGQASASRIQPCDLAEIIGESIKLTAASIPESVEVNWERPACAAPAIVDPIQIHQVVMNLIINAVHAMHNGGVLSIRLKQIEMDGMTATNLGDINPGPFLKLEIADTGIGMEPSTLARIFDPFFTTKPAGAGTGVGLSVVQRIVRNHDGVITVESEPAQGSTFHVYFPRASTSEKELKDSQKEGNNVPAEKNPVCG